MYIYIYVHVSLSLFIYIYIYMYVSGKGLEEGCDAAEAPAAPGVAPNSIVYYHINTYGWYLFGC